MLYLFQGEGRQKMKKELIEALREECIIRQDYLLLLERARSLPNENVIDAIQSAISDCAENMTDIILDLFLDSIGYNDEISMDDAEAIEMAIDERIEKEGGIRHINSYDGYGECIGQGIPVSFFENLLAESFNVRIKEGDCLAEITMSKTRASIGERGWIKYEK